MTSPGDMETLRLGCLVRVLKNTVAIKRYGKGLLVQIKEEGVYEVLTNKEFTNETDSPLKKVEPRKKFNIQWGTVYSRDLANLQKKR